MIFQLAQLLDIGQTAIAAFGVVFLRVGAVMAILPAFGERSVPARVRLVLALAFSAIVFPAVAPDLMRAMDGAAPLAFLGTEVVAGLLMGIAFRLFVLALQMAGTIAAQATSLAQIFGGEAVEPQPALGHLMVVSGLALAVMTGLHVKVAHAMIGSYTVMPVGVFVPPGELLSWGISLVGYIFGLSFSLAAPFVIASMVYNLALGAINRAMPQLMVAFVGAPAITAGAMILLFLTLPLLLPVWLSAFDASLSDPMRRY